MWIGQVADNQALSMLTQKAIRDCCISVNLRQARLEPWFLPRAEFPRERLPRTYNFRAMLNYIWLGLMVLAVIIGGCTDNLKAVADRASRWLSSP